MRGTSVPSKAARWSSRGFKATTSSPNRPAPLSNDPLDAVGGLDGRLMLPDANDYPTSRFQRLVVSPISFDGRRDLLLPPVAIAFG